MILPKKDTTTKTDHKKDPYLRRKQNILRKGPPPRHAIQHDKNLYKALSGQLDELVKLFGKDNVKVKYMVAAREEGLRKAKKSAQTKKRSPERKGGLAGALELLAENQPVVGHAYETLHMLGAAAKIAGGSGAAQSSLNSIRIVQVDWGSVRSGHSGIFKGYNLIIGEGANVYTIESTFGEILNWKPDWLITRDLLFAAGVERLDQLKFQKYTGKEGKVVPTGMIHGGARYVPAAVLERKETTAAALLDYKCMREGCGNVFKATGTTTTDMRCVNGTKVGCQSTKVVRVKLAYKAVGEGGAMKIKLSREAEPL